MKLRNTSRHGIPVAVVCLVLLPGSDCLASAFVHGAYYRLGDADPGAAAGAVGNNPTVDSFANTLHLSRGGLPHYAADVPALGPAGNKFSMAFANEGLGGPAFPGNYVRAESLPVVVQGIAFEAWVNSGPTNLDQIRTSLVAYNGNPQANGFGFFNHGENYVLRLGSAAVPVGGAGGGPIEQVLGPAEVGKWHHLAYVYSLGTSSYYYDGTLVAQSASDPAPIAPDGGFWLGGQGLESAALLYPFNGWIDEVRLQSFNPIAAGAFEPTAFLIVPEPLCVYFLPAAAALTLTRRRR